ncbi:MAG: hypothetical protein WBO08_16855 [Mycobacterium sp.]|nr:hypothetical protein [Mycobacterium sp.]
MPTCSPSSEQLAGEIAAGPKGSNPAFKQLLLNTYGADVEGQMELEAGSSPQRRRRRRLGYGIAAFLGKRAPDFQ